MATVKKIKNKEVLILGTGPGIENHKKSIEDLRY